jgi:SnoaL-like domain
MDAAHLDRPRASVTRVPTWSAVGKSSILEELEVARVVIEERHWRDRGDWDAMARAYHADSRVTLAWFDGSGAAFVEVSRNAPQPGYTTHRLSPPVVRVAGDRAVAETSAVVETRTTLLDVEVDLFVSCRYLSRLRRDGGGWRLASLETICEKDSVSPVDPARPPEFDPELLASFRRSYRFVSYRLHATGLPVNPLLPGDDKPSLVQPLYQRARSWLEGR